LTYAVDHTPKADGHVRVGYAPGTRWQYSGAGYALLQRLVEQHFMQQTVFDPLGMTRATFGKGGSNRSRRRRVAASKASVRRGNK
jgi:CubicO group peptidase (beta-lactamase class C family)